MKAVVFMLILSTVTLRATSYQCPPRNEPYVEDVEGRSCRKACTQDSDCKGALKRCICDGSCGKSCIGPETTCLEPKPIDNGIYFKTSLKFGEGYVMYRCNDGFILKGRAVRRCNSDKKWSFSDQLPHCIRICTKPHLPNNGQLVDIEMDQDTFSIGHAIEFTCNDGFMFSGRREITCEEEGVWEPSDYNCVDAGCEVNLNLPPGLDVKLPSYKDKYTYFYQHNHKYTFYCMNNEEYSTVLTCANGRWSKDLSLFECDSGRGFTETCTRPPPPHGGHFYGRNRNQPNFEIGDEMLFSCNVGYEVSGWNGITCRKGGVWDPADYNLCINAGCEVTFDLSPDVEVVDVPVGDVLDYKYQQNHQYTFQCMLNHAYNTVLTCNNGRWSDDFSLLDCDNGAGFTVNSVLPKTTVATKFVSRTTQQPAIESCQRPNDPANGFFNDDKQLFSVGERLHVVCKIGFEPVEGAPMDLVCQSNGTWSEDAYDCTGVIERVPPEVREEAFGLEP